MQVARGEAVSAERFLLFTMSRAICDTPAATEWARAEIRKVLDPRTSVIAGDACSDEVAQMLSIGTAAKWCLDGRVMYRMRGPWWEEARWHNSPLPKRGRGHHEEWRQLCLARNIAMVNHWACRDDVFGLGIVAPWATTQGTDHTLSAMRLAGLPEDRITRLVCPAELGPNRQRRLL